MRACVRVCLCSCACACARVLVLVCLCSCMVCIDFMSMWVSPQQRRHISALRNCSHSKSGGNIVTYDTYTHVCLQLHKHACMWRCAQVIYWVINYTWVYESLDFLLFFILGCNYAFFPSFAGVCNDIRTTAHSRGSYCVAYSYRLIGASICIK